MRRIVQIISDVGTDTYETFEKTLTLVLKALFTEAKRSGRDWKPTVSAIFREVFAGVYWIFFHGTHPDAVGLFESWVKDCLGEFTYNLKEHLKEETNREKFRNS